MLPTLFAISRMAESACLFRGLGLGCLMKKRVEIVNKLCSNGFKVLLFTSNRHNGLLIHV